MIIKRETFVAIKCQKKGITGFLLLTVKKKVYNLVSSTQLNFKMEKNFKFDKKKRLINY